MRIPISKRFKKVTAFTGLVAALVLVGMTFQALPAAATDEDCTDFGYVEGFKADNVNEETYEWPDGYSVAVVKSGSDGDFDGHELIFSSEIDPIVHSTGKDISHIHFCSSPDNPAIEIVKSGSPAVAHEGDPVTYTFLVTNTGDVDLTNVSVDDDILGHIGDIASLPEGEDATLEFETVAPGDDVTNVATACGFDPSQVEVCDDDDHSLDVIHPDIEIVKTGAETAQEGDEVEYSFLVTNTGDVDLTNVSVDDDILGHIGDIASLPAGEDETLTKAVDAPADDVRNVAEACGLDPLQEEVCSEDDHTIDVIHPAIDVVKSGAEFAHEGDEVTYTFTVSNIGDVDLTNVSVDDDILGHIGDVPSLAVDAEAELTKTMVVPAATSAVDNEATACAGEAPCDTDIHHLTVIHPAITIDKKVGGGDHKPVDDALVAHEGDELGYTVLITNTGDTPLEITALADSLSDAVPGSCSLNTGDTLEPGDDFTCVYTMDATSADAHNVVSVTGEDVLGGEKGTVGGEDETFVRVIDPEIQVVTVATPETVEPGQDVTYTYEVTNIGDTDLVDVEVSDDILGDIGTVDSLAPGEEALLSTTTTIQADSPRTNVATACGSDELGLSACDTDDATITIVLPAGPEGRDGGDVLPTTGFNLTLWVAAGIALIATGLVLIQSKGEGEPV